MALTSPLWLQWLRCRSCGCCCSGTFCCDSCRCLFSSWQMHTVSFPVAVRLQFDMRPLYQLAVLTGCVWKKLTAVERSHVLLTVWQALAKVSTPILPFLFDFFEAAPLISFVLSWHLWFPCYFPCRFFFLCCFILQISSCLLQLWPVVCCGLMKVILFSTRHFHTVELFHVRSITQYWMCFMC